MNSQVCCWQGFQIFADRLEFWEGTRYPNGEEYLTIHEIALPVVAPMREFGKYTALRWNAASREMRPLAINLDLAAVRPGANFLTCATSECFNSNGRLIAYRPRLPSGGVSPVSLNVGGSPEEAYVEVTFRLEGTGYDVATPGLRGAFYSEWRGELWQRLSDVAATLAAGEASRRPSHSPLSSSRRY